MENAEQITKYLVVKIKKFMFANNLTQTNIAESGIISFSYLNNILNGKKIPSERLIYKLDEYMKNYEGKNT